MIRLSSLTSNKPHLAMTLALGGALTIAVGLAVLTPRVPSAVPAAAPLAEREEARPQLAEPAAPSTAGLSGTVLETLAASKYTYLRLATAGGEVWAAVPSATVALGASVTIADASRMADFKSATLKRTFKEIYFGTLAAPSAANAPARFSPADVLDNDEQQALPPGHPNVAGSTTPGSAIDETQPLPPGHPDIGRAALSPAADAPPAAAESQNMQPITRATGGNAHDIAELSAARQRLAGQRVRVRGQVSKVTPNVQGHTFFHLRDGSAETTANGKDLVVTSTTTPTLGQVATFEGTLRADVDIGIGFVYPVLLENATPVGP